MQAYRITPVKSYPASTFAKTFCSLEGEFIKFAQLSFLQAHIYKFQYPTWVKPQLQVRDLKVFFSNMYRRAGQNINENFCCYVTWMQTLVFGLDTKAARLQKVK
jgi:hypothetical protein